MLGALAAAMSSAAFFAVGGALQHRRAGETSTTSPWRMLGTLARQPGWLLGIALCVVAFLLHAVALSLGDLTLVQPVILSGIVLTVFARSAIDRRWPSTGDMVWVALTWLGLVAFLAALRPGAEGDVDDSMALIMAVCGAGSVGVLVLFARRDHPLRRGLLLACAAGILFGLVAGMLKLSTVAARDGLIPLLSQWPLWALLVIGAGAVLLNQLAYQATRISVSAPVLNLSQLLVSMAFGVIVLDERLFATPGTLAVELAGLALVALGVSRLAIRTAISDERQAAARLPPDHGTAEDPPRDASSRTR